MKWPIFAYNKRDRLREMRTRGREGVKNPENFAYVLNGSPLTSPSRSAEVASRFVEMIGLGKTERNFRQCLMLAAPVNVCPRSKLSP